METNHDKILFAEMEERKQQRLLMVDEKTFLMHFGIIEQIRETAKSDLRYITIDYKELISDPILLYSDGTDILRAVQKRLNEQNFVVISIDKFTWKIYW